MIPEGENRGHRHHVSHVAVKGHGVADTVDASLAASMARSELERRECLDCDGLGHQPVCVTCGGSGDEPDA